MARNIGNIKNILEKLKLDGVLIKSKTLKKYLGTLTGSGVLVLITKNDGYLILDGRYIEEAKESERDFAIIENTPAKSKLSHFDVVKKIYKDNGYLNLGIENTTFSVKEYEKLKGYGLNITLISDELDKARIIKSEEEIEMVKEACKITDYIFDSLLKHIKVGVTENEVSAWLHYYSIKAGASKMSFDPVITSGERTALPHGRPTDKKIKRHEPIMIDFGIEYKNYQSDMTRMVFLGEPSSEIKKIYNIVKTAQEEGIKAIKKGAVASDVDKVVRNIIDKQGYGENYNHGLGHGIGIGDGCEYPFLNQSSDTILEENMIMSCEPGIYVKGLGGVRIEDDVLIKNGIGIPLNRTTKEMIILEE